MQFEAVLPIKVGATAIDRVGIEGGTGEVGIGLGLLHRPAADAKRRRDAACTLSAPKVRPNARC